MTIEEFKKIVLEEPDIQIIDEKCPEDLMGDSSLWDKEMLEAYAKKGNISVKEAKRLIDDGWIAISKEEYTEGAE